MDPETTKLLYSTPTEKVEICENLLNIGGRETDRSRLKVLDPVPVHKDPYFFRSKAEHRRKKIIKKKKTEKRENNSNIKKETEG